MDVGLYFSNNSPHCGGEYTYEQEIFDSLLSLADKSNHTFVIFSKESIEKNIPRDLSICIRNIVLPKQNIIEFLLLYCIHNFFPNSPFSRRLYPKLSHLERYARRNKIDIMIFFYPHHEPIDIPYITVLWDLEHRNQPWFPEVSGQGEWNFREGWYIPCLQRATYIITGTKAGQQEISLFYGIPQNKIKLLPFPTPNYVLNTKTDIKNSDILIKYNLKKEYLFYPAQYWPHKNHANLLYALKMVRETYNIPVFLIFVGSDMGNLLYLKKLTRELKLTEWVQFLGFIPREDLIALYQNAFALVFPTFFGPDNLPPLEAFALRCPVIASNVPGAEEQLGDAALLVDPKNPEAIAKAIETLYHNWAKRAELIEKGYQRAIRWTGKEYVREIVSLLDDFENIRRCWE